MKVILAIGVLLASLALAGCDAIASGIMQATGSALVQVF